MSSQYINEEALTQLGINLEGQDKETLLTHLNQTLEERIGTEIAESLDDDKLEKLVELQNNASDEDLGRWLQTNVPEMKQIIQDEIDILVGDIAENGDAINNIK